MKNKKEKPALKDTVAEDINISNEAEVSENTELSEDVPSKEIEVMAEDTDTEETEVEVLDESSEDTAEQTRQNVKHSEKHEEKSEGIKKEEKKIGKRYDFFYFFELALKSMANNIGMALASLCVLMSCLVVLGSCFLLIVNINVNLENFGSLNQIIVYCEYDASDESVRSVGEKLSLLENVSAVTLVSKEESLDDLVDEYHSYSDIFTEIFDGRDNPLSDSYIVEYEDNKFVGELVYKVAALEGVRKVNNRADLSIKVENFKNGVTFIFIAFFIMLFVTGFYIVVNTIKMALHYRRYDIIVMKYIGATNAFVLTPFLLEGMIIGILASSLGYIVQHLIYVNIVNATRNALGSILTLVNIGDYGLFIWLVFLIVGILCGLLGSLTSIHKNLKA